MSDRDKDNERVKWGTDTQPDRQPGRLYQKMLSNRLAGRQPRTKTQLAPKIALYLFLLTSVYATGFSG